MRYAAILHEDGRETRLGAVDIDDKGVIRPEPGAEAEGKFERFIEESNAAKIMHIDVPPRPGAREFTLASAIIPRGDPRFIEALKEQATTYYGIELRPE